MEKLNKIEFTLAHDYLLIREFNKENKLKNQIQIPINEARNVLIELLKDDTLSEEHVSKYKPYGCTEYVIKSQNGWKKSKVI